MASESTLYSRELDIFYRVIGIICQSFVFGIYACLFPLSTYTMMKKGLQTRLRKVLFGITIFMFSLSSVLWITTIVDLFRVFKLWLLDSRFTEAIVPQIFTLFNALALINYLLTDGVVVWRAWVLCHDDYRRALFVPLFFLFCTAVSAGSTIGIRTTLTVISFGHLNVTTKHLTRAIDVSQVTNLTMSLLTNTASTLIVSWKAWRYRRSIKNELNNAIERRTKAGKILLLLVESGVLYSISCATVLAGILIRLPAFTVGDIYTPMNVQIAGIYPIVVLLLVDKQQSSFERTIFTGPKLEARNHYRRQDTTTSSPEESSELETMQFHVRNIRHSGPGHHQSILESVTDLHPRGAKGEDFDV